MRCAANCLAGGLLLLTAASHVAMVFVGHPSQYSPNMVLLVLPNWAIQVLAAAFELTVGAVCIRCRGRDVASVVTVLFIALMVWYHWALSFTGGGGQHCNCLGVLGLALHLSSAEERVAPFVLLVLLSITVAPWAASKIRARAAARITHAGRRHTHAVLLIAFAAWGCWAEDALRVEGSCVSHTFNTRTGVAYEYLTVRASFSCLVYENAWDICLTNVDLGNESVGRRTPWERIAFDGTNIYTLMPYHIEAQGRS